MSTVWNCNYFRPSSLAALASTCDGERSASIQAVFRAMLLGVLKTQEIVWEECCKGQVYEVILVPTLTSPQVARSHDETILSTKMYT